MYKKIKGQSSVELMMILVFILFIISGIMYFVGKVSLDIQDQGAKNELDNFAESITDEFAIIQKVEGGYSRTIKIPNHLMNRFNVSVNTSSGYLSITDKYRFNENDEEYFYYSIPTNFNVSMYNDTEGNYYLKISNSYLNNYEGLILEELNSTVIESLSKPQFDFYSDNVGYVNYGDSVNLFWNFINQISSCEATGDWSGTKTSSGSATFNIYSDSTYYLNCTNSKGSNLKSITVELNPLTAPTLNFNSNDTLVSYQDIVNLSWSGNNVHSCVASGNWTGSKAISSSEITVPLLRNSTFILTCNDTLNILPVTKSVFVEVAVNLALQFNISHLIVPYNSSINLTWDSFDSDNCIASDGWSGAKSLSGTETILDLTSSQTFNLTCTNLVGDSITKSVNVTVLPLPSITFVSTPNNVYYNDAASLSWSVLNANTCTASGDWSGSKNVSGTQSTGSLTSSKTYTLTCSGPGGTASKDITVTVTMPSLPVVSLSSASSIVDYNSATNLNWNVIGDFTTCSASGAWSGSKSLSGTQSTGSLTSSKTYTLTCSNPSGSNSDSVSVAVHTYHWETSSWGSCSATCGGGTQTRSVTCHRDADNSLIADSYCTTSKPSTSQSCNTQACVPVFSRNTLCSGDRGTCRTNTGHSEMSSDPQACNPGSYPGYVIERIESSFCPPSTSSKYVSGIYTCYDEWDSNYPGGGGDYIYKVTCTLS